MVVPLFQGQGHRHVAFSKALFQKTAPVLFGWLDKGRAFLVHCFPGKTNFSWMCWDNVLVPMR